MPLPWRWLQVRMAGRKDGPTDYYPGQGINHGRFSCEGCRNIKTELAISQGCVIHEQLASCKVPTTWVPQNLTLMWSITTAGNTWWASQSSQNSSRRLYHSAAKWRQNKASSWLQDPETKLEPLQQQHKGLKASNTFCLHSTAGNIMASIFWDAKGIMMIDYMYVYKLWSQGIFSIFFFFNIQVLRLEMELPLPRRTHMNILIRLSLG